MSKLFRPGEGEEMMAQPMKTTYYNVFVRTWWKRNPAWPGGKEPGAGKKRYLARHVTYADARAIAKQYNDTHKPGFLSKKAEFEEA
jgi:hypothetical protein